MYSVELESFKSHIPAVIEDSLRGYGGLTYKNHIKPELGRILETVADREIEGDVINIEPFRYDLLSLVLKADFNTPVVGQVLSLLFKRSEQDESIRTTQLRANIQNYGVLLVNSLSQDTYLKYDNYLTDVEGYQYSSDRINLQPRQIDKSKRIIYTLYKKSRLWSSFSVDKPMKALLEKAGVGYEPTVVYGDFVYKGVIGKKTNLLRFTPEEWVKYRSTRLDPDNRFKALFNSSLDSLYTQQFQSSQDVNEITSDSKIHTVVEQVNLNEADVEGLINTFGGMGKRIYNRSLALLTDSEHFGGYQGSPVGGMDYMASLSKIIQECAKAVSDNPVFGDFDTLFSSAPKLDQISGLKFLNKLGKTKSFNHALSVPSGVNLSQNKITFNPIYAKFYQGLGQIPGILFPAQEQSSYKSSPETDPLRVTLSYLLERCCAIGDSVQDMLSSLDDRGRLRGFECLGSVEYQLLALRNVFPTKVIVTNHAERSGGLGGALSYMLVAYDKILSVTDSLYLPSYNIEALQVWLESIEGSVDKLAQELYTVGIRTSGSGLLPNIETKVYGATQQDLASYLKSLGFETSEVENILGIGSFEELVSKFAPISDSSDLKSFFRGYELAQLILEFSGQKGLDAFLSYLYEKSPIDSLLNILKLTEKNPSIQSSLQVDKYPRLVGLLITLTYAVNPEELSRLSELLGSNQLSLLDSVSKLLEQADPKPTGIKQKNDISLLGGVVDQLIRGRYEDMSDLSYKDASPRELERWTRIIDGSLGNAKRDSIYRLYDKSTGLTIKELISVLNNPSPTSSLGLAIDGFSGGELTKLLKYANLSGLALKLSYYKNSSQLNNKLVDFSRSVFTLPSLLTGLEKLVSNIKMVRATLDIISRTTSKQTVETNQIFQIQNREFQALVDLISNEFLSSSNYAIKESPGTGNSRLPNRAEAPNSISPEQANFIISNTTPNQLSLNMSLASEPYVDGFIKITEKNRFLNGISGCSMSAPSGLASPNPVPEPSTKTSDPSGLISNPPSPIINSGPGKNYLRPTYRQSPLTKPFNPYESCKKFSGANCEELYPVAVRDRSNTCAPGVNKSLAPQESTGNVSNTNSVKIDRALGYFSEYSPSSGDLVSRKTPSYYDIFDSSSVKIGPQSEPVVDLNTQIKSGTHPALLSEYASTRYAISKFISSTKKEHTELTCSSISAAHEYQICMNVMKCKKSKVRLPFCPNTLQGGR